MRKSLLLFIALLVSIGSHLLAQQEVRFGQHRVVPEQNVARTRGATKNALAAVSPAQGKVNVLMQFREVPDAKALRRLARAGVVLEGYAGGNAYFAQVMPGSKPSDFARFRATSVIGMRPEWKVSSVLTNGRIPEWADRGNGRVEVTVYWFSNVDAAYARSFAQNLGYAVGEESDVLSAMTLTLPVSKVKSLASEPWVRFVTPIEPPHELLNYGGRALGGVMPAVQPVNLGGRGLTGHGVRVGLWDGNLEHHVDYGDRVHVKEFEMSVDASGGHGMHTAATIMGAGILNPKARGMAPKAELYAYNFNTGRNGLSVAREMMQAHKSYNIALTSNSYGIRLGRLCSLYDQLSYSANPSNLLTDILSNIYPTMTHFFSAGNSQGECDKLYGSNFARCKNVVYVGAVDESGAISGFSSFGPMDDGRLTPTVSAKGVNVISAVGSNGYESMSGTSMACPTTSGIAALLTERYHQLHGGQHMNSALLKGILANTADDRGNAGPDYQYGYGLVNLEAALTALEGGWYREGVVENGVAAPSQTIAIPAGVRQVRVMLTWIDPVVVKDYPYGEPALINDLDLSVSLAGSTTQPWVLKAAEPEKGATRGIDVLNNIEQVTIDNPAAGEATITIAGHDKIREGIEQRYALTWYFDYGRPTLLHPIGGELFSVGDAVRLRTQNMQGDTRVEISYDNGKSYLYLHSVESPFSSQVTIPKDAPQTTQARVRLTDSKGNVLVSPHTFTIAPTPRELRGTSTACSQAGWKLTWQPLEGVSEYTVLRADVPNGEWEKIGDTDKVEFEIPADKVIAGGRNVYAVAVKMADGSQGPRSLGVLVAGASSMALTDADLPFAETFIDLPLPYATLTGGENISTSWVETPSSFEFPLGSHVLQVRSKDEVTGELFSDAKNIFTLGHCELDLMGVSSGKKLLFYCLNGMYPYEKSDDTQLRLMVNGSLVKTVRGENSYTAPGVFRDMVWDISQFVGQKVKLEMQFACNQEDGRIMILEYGVREITDAPDVGLYFIGKVQQKPNMGVEELVINVYSSMLKTVEKLPLVVSLDGRVYNSLIVKDLQPFEERMVRVPVDFSTTVAEGHKFEVSASVSLENETAVRDNVAKTTVYNMGTIFPLPPANPGFFFGMKLLQDPKITKEVDAPIIFTDDGGLLAGYGGDHVSSVKFVPADPNKVIYLSVKKCRLDGDDVLQVYADGLKEDFVYKDESPTYEFTSAKGKEAKAFISGAEDGAITMLFNSRYFMQSDEGWVAEVRQIDRSNSLTLQPIEVAASYPDQKAQIKIKVKNLTPVDQKEVAGTLTSSNLSKPIDFVIPNVPAHQEIEYAIADEIEVPYPTCVDLVVVIKGVDADARDNIQTVTLWNDKFWHGGKVSKPDDQGLVRAEVYPDEVRFGGIEGGARHSYHLDKVLPLYLGTKNPLVIKIKKAPASGDPAAKLHVWIDLDDTDSELKSSAPEYYSVALEEGKDEYTIPIDLTSAPSLQAGKRRMRIAVLRDDEKDKYIAGEDVTWGRSMDILADVKDGANPNANDLKIAISTALHSGTGLSAAQQVEVEVVNNGHAAVKDVQVSLSFDGKVVATEKIEDKIEGFGGEAVYTFKQTVDLSSAGTHTVSVKLPDDGVLENNEDAREVISVLPSASGKIYALSFSGSKEEYVDFSSLLSGRKKVTFEGWFKLNQSQLAPLFQAAGMVVAAVSGAGDDLPENGIIVLGQRMLIYSGSDVLTPGKFHHVAVTMEVKGNFLFQETIVNVYIDGKKVGMTGSSKEALAFRRLTVGKQLDGKAKMLRFWSKVLEESEIAASMAKSVRSGSGELPAGCVAEFEVNEGAQAYIASGNSRIAHIVSGRVDAPKDNIWEEQKLISTVNFKGQLLPTAADNDGAFNVLMPNDFADYANVTGEIVTLWPNAKVTYKGGEVTADTKFDFSDPGREIKVSASGTVFGVALEQNDVTIRLVQDKNPEAKITKLELLVDENANLGEAITLDNPTQTVILTVKDKSASETLDLSKVKVTFTGLSPAATLHYLDKTITAGGKLDFDLRNPVTVKVLAENERNFTYYTLQVQKEQVITWESKDLELVYTNKTRPLAATSSSGLPVTYRSENPNVAMMDAQGNLHTVGVGSTVLFAMAPAEGVYAAAAPVARKVTVTPASLTIAPFAMETEEAQSLPEVRLQYTGLLFNEVKSAFRQPVYEVYKDAATVWASTMGPLAPGVYSLRAKDYTAPYADGNYLVTLGEGTLTVKASTLAKSVNFTVTDGAAAVQGADVSIGDAVLSTPEGGRVAIRLRPGEYQYEVSKDGYRAVEGTVKVESADVDVPVTLPKLEVTLTYAVDGEKPNGAIYGELEQLLPKGGSGSSVTAVPESGYRFAGWDDGKNEPSRRDENVASNTRIVASFEAMYFTLSYSVGEGGEWVNGEKVQTLKAGEMGTEIEVRAAAGYVFLGWSDGVTTLKRQDKVATAGFEVKASFYKMFSLPVSEDFEFYDGIPYAWRVDNHSTTGGNIWTYGKLPNTFKESRTRGSYIYIDGSTPPKGILQNTDFVTPWIDISGVTEDIQIQYDLFFRTYGYGSLTLLYSFDGVAWVEIDKRETSIPYRTEPTERFTIEASALAGKSRLQVKWSYAAEWDGNVAIDNVAITEGSGKQSIEYYAGEHGKLTSPSHADPRDYIKVVTSSGAPGEAVTAVPDEGYMFYRWSDNQSSATRKDDANGRYKAIFVQAPKTKHEVIYLAGPEGRIEGLPYQLIEEGGSSLAVIAEGKDPGMRFDKWSDGRTDNPRIDDNVSANISVSASFTPHFSVTYAATGDGYGELVATVDGKLLPSGAFVDPGTKVAFTATPESGCAVAAWMGVVATQQDVSAVELVVNENVEVKAEFVRLRGMLTFIAVKAGSGEPVAGATVAIDKRYPKASDDKGKAEFASLLYGRYDYTVVAEGYASVVASTELDGKVATQKVELLANDAAKLTFIVSADGAPVEGAIILVAGQKLLTKANGEAGPITLNKGTYDYTVEKPSYAMVAGKVVFADDDQSVSVALLKAATLTFVVKDAAGSAVQGAEVSLGAKKQTTDSEGKAAFENLAVGEYSYSVTKSGYKKAEGKKKLEVGGATVEVKLEKKTNAVESVLLNVVTLRPNPAGATLYVEHAAAVERLKVVTLQGEVLLQQRNLGGAQEMTIPLANVAEGMYILVVEGDGAQRAIPFVVAR